MRIKYLNEFILNMGLGDTTTCVYQLNFDEIDSNNTNIIQYLLCMAGIVHRGRHFLAHISMCGNSVIIHQ